VTKVEVHPPRERLRETPIAPVALAPAVELIGLSKSIDDRPILRELSLTIEAGQFVAVLGANGTGKTTLLKILSTLVPPSSGELLLFGERATGTSVSLRRRIGLIGHQSMLYRDLSARENLEFFGKLYAVNDPVDRARQMLDMIGLSPRANDPVKNFSRGMVQRVAIARALLPDPALLLADEPFDGLDAPSIESLQKLLTKLNDAGTTIVTVLHDIEQCLKLSGRAIVLRGGRVVLDQPSCRLFAREVLSEVRP
jgi:heme exporter protein A